jgi:predicted TIM-barrel fold metal-dependent hydrolase
MNGWFPEDPVETFRRHVWVNPFWEDRADDVIDAVGVDRVIFGSDWPHIEALPEPLQYVAEVEHLDAADQRRILLDNTSELNELRPA